MASSGTDFRIATARISVLSVRDSAAIYVALAAAIRVQAWLPEPVLALPACHMRH